MVDVGFVVEQHAIFGAFAAKGIDLPGEFDGQLLARLAPHVHAQILERGGLHLHVVVQLQHAHEHFVASRPLDAQSHMANLVRMADAVKHDVLLLPLPGCGGAHGVLFPRRTHLDDEIESRFLHALCPRLHGKACIRSSRVPTELRAEQHDVGARCPGRALDAKTRTTHVGVVDGEFGLQVRCSSRGAGVAHQPAVGGHNVLCREVIPRA